MGKRSAVSALALVWACSSNGAMKPSTDAGHAAVAGASSQLVAGQGAGAASGPRDASTPMPQDARAPSASPSRDAAPAPNTASTMQGRDARVDEDAGGSPDAATAVDTAPPKSRSLSCPSGTMAYPNPLPNDRQAKLVQSNFGFIEGPVWIAAQNQLLFSDMDFSTADNPQGPDAVIRRFTPPATFDVFVTGSGSNGLALANDGRVIAASHAVQSLTYFDLTTGGRELRALDYQGKHFNSPNDLAVRADGNIYFTDPDYQIGPRSSETKLRGVYRVSPSGAVSLIDGSLDQPNGIALSPDESTLYVGSAGNEVFSYALAADGGGTGTRKVFAAPGASDGLGIDCAGNLYVTAATVQVFDPGGAKLGEITVAEPPSNVAFGGPNRTTLFITAQGGLYSIELRVPGRCY
jgi:gluconolactonase